jgi:alkylation response protein AidB-like acyl-CoA dehydrogenase
MTDPAPLDFDLGEMADTIRETTRRFADDKIAPIAAEIDQTDEFPRHLWPQMGELGLHGITVEEEWGGLGLGYVEHVVAQEEVARASASVGLSYGAHSNLCINQIRRWANPEQKKKYLPKLISGEHVGALAMSEAGAGSDVVSMKLKAERSGNGYRLNGTKFWITNGSEAETLVVYALTGEGSRGMQVGIMQACLDVVLPYVRERKQFGKPIGSFQLMQAKIADMYVALNSARAYVYQVAKACDQGKTTRHDAAGAILLASENAVKVANEAVQALGGAGYTKDWPVERYYRDAKLLDIGAGTNEIRRMLIGRELIGV